jgi:tetratricopeptide (TPR) repeat protein
MTVDAVIDTLEGAPSSTRGALDDTRESSSRRVRRRRDLRDEYSHVLLIVALVVSAMGLGGMHWAALVPSALAALIAGFLAVRSMPERAACAPALVPLALCGFTLLQIVPLPIGVLQSLSPHMAGVWRGALAPFGEELRWGTLSADPSATLAEALKWAAYAGALAAAIAAGIRRGVWFGATVLFGCAVLVATTTLLHGMLNSTRVYGLYLPTFPASRWRVGPFLNPNNLAGYLNLGLFCGIGLMLAPRPGLPRIVIGVGAASLAAVVVLGASRAGLGAMALALVSFGVLALTIRWRRRTSGGLSTYGVLAALGGVVTFALILAWLGGTEETARALFDKNIEKIDVLHKVTPLLADYAWFGVGRGAFESVFPAYHFGAANVVYAHPENFVVQWVSEWGVPMGAAALSAFAWVALGAFRAARQSLTSAGVWAGIAAVLLQNLLDLGLELPGLAFATTTALGILWGQARRERGASGSPRRGNLASRILAWGVLGLGGALAIGVAAFSRSTATNDRVRIHDAVARTQLRDPNALAATRAALREAMLRHPADPYFPRAGGLLAWYSHENPMPWMARSLERGMEIGQTHFALARMLARLGATSQSLLELRLASTYSPGLVMRASRLAISMTRNFDELLQAVPDGVAGQSFLHAMALNLKRTDAPELRVRALLGTIERAPANVSARSMLAEDLSFFLAAEGPISICADERRGECERLIEEQIEALYALEPKTSTAVVTKAQYLASVGRLVEAEAMLQKECHRFTGGSLAQCQRRRVALARATGSREKLDAASRDLAGAGCGSSKACGELYAFLGGQAENLGDLHRALGYYKRAVAEEPNDSRWGALARIAGLLGDQAGATVALSHLKKGRPEDRDVERRLDELRRRALLNGAR